MQERLTPKQQAFVNAYQGEAKGNGVQSARIAGYKGSDETLRAVAYENLTKPHIAASLAQKTAKAAQIAEKRIVNVYEEFLENLEFTRKLRNAATKWVQDPNSDEFTVAPRDNEIDVVYWDFSGEIPTQKTQLLSTILERIAEKGYKAPSPFIKTVDLRDYCLKVVDRCDLAIDKFAKMGGEYSKEKENPLTVAEIQATIKANVIANMKLAYPHFSDDKIAQLTAKPLEKMLGAQEVGDVPS